MKIKLYRSSTVGVKFDNFSILFDPWLTDDEYFGSWSHVPPFDIKKNLDELNSYKSIYISHIHPDHCSISTLEYLNKDIPIYIHKFKSPFIRAKIERLGFKVIEIEHGEYFNLNEETLIRVFAADNCDPSLCYKFTGCADLKSTSTNQIDTFCYLENKNYNIVNLNDCPYGLVSNFINKIKFKKKRIDLLLTAYSGAGPYPQCVTNLSEEVKILEARKKKYNFLDQCFNYIKAIKPRYYLPFAGTYFLSGKLSNLNNLRGVSNIDEAYDYLEDRCKKENIDSKPLKINYETEFDFNNEIISPYTRQDKNKIIDYIKNNLSSKKYSYETANENINEEEIFNLAKNAYSKMYDKMLINNFKSKTILLIEYSNKYISLNLQKKEFKILTKEKIKLKKPYLIINLNPNLLYNLLKGPKYAHWNNAEIGSHLSFDRHPNIYERGLHTSLSYFHS